MDRSSSPIKRVGVVFSNRHEHFLQMPLVKNVDMYRVVFNFIILHFRYIFHHFLEIVLYCILLCSELTAQKITNWILTQGKHYLFCKTSLAHIMRHTYRPYFRLAIDDYTTEVRTVSKICAMPLLMVQFWLGRIFARGQAVMGCIKSAPQSKKTARYKLSGQHNKALLE